MWESSQIASGAGEADTRVELDDPAIELRVRILREQNDHVVAFSARGTREPTMFLQWGLTRPGCSPWERPDAACWPEGSSAEAEGAVRSPFRPSGPDEQTVAIRLNARSDGTASDLAVGAVLYLPERRRWVRAASGSDLHVALPRAAEPPAVEASSDDWTPGVGVRDTLERFGAEGEEVGPPTVFDLGGPTVGARVAVAATSVQVIVVTDHGEDAVLHWGQGRRWRDTWERPDPTSWPPDSREMGGGAVQTPFERRGSLQGLVLRFERKIAPDVIHFVVHTPRTNAWLKHDGGDMTVALGSGGARSAGDDSAATGLIERIAAAELEKSSWTLMHRFALCRDLLEQVGDDSQGLALLYTWLRFSQLRQLDWQRNYNTKPRELAHAQQALARLIARVYASTRAGRPLLRLMLGTIGEGRNGQRIRDQILEIMHRHHLPEDRSTFMEQWHQKMHNNTTPDDIVICEA